MLVTLERDIFASGEYNDKGLNDMSAALRINTPSPSVPA
jgi:hypothetical protein